MKGTKRYVGEKVHRKFHATVSEAEQDNAAIETAHHAERLGEQAFRKGKNTVKSSLEKAKTNLGKQRQNNVAATEQQLNSKVPATDLVSGSSSNMADSALKPSPFHSTAKEPMNQASKMRHSPKVQKKSDYLIAKLQAGKPISGVAAVMSISALQFGQSVSFAPKEKGVLSKGLQKGKTIGKSGLQFGGEKLDMKVRSELDRTDNSSVTMAQEVEGLAERPVKYLGRRGGNAIKKPVVNTANKAERRPPSFPCL